MSVNYIDLSKRLYALYSPYFGLKGKAFWRTFYASSIVVANLSLAIIYSLLNSSMNAMIGVLEQPGVTYSAFFGSLGGACGYIALSVIMGLVKDRFVISLRNSLSHAIDKNFSLRWLNNHAYYGLKFILHDQKDDKQEINPAQVMSYDNADLTHYLIKLSDNFMLTLFRFFTGIVGLYLLSQPLGLTLFSTTFFIPGYMAIASIVYAFGYNLITQRWGTPLRKLELDARDSEAKLYEKSHYLDHHAESIALKKGSLYELAGLKKNLKEKSLLRNTIDKIHSSLDFITSLHNELAYLIPIVLSVPNIIAQKMKVSEIFEIMPHFQSVVALFTWKNQHYDKITSSEVSLTRIEKLNGLLGAWEEDVKKQKTSQVEFVARKKNHKNIELNNITLLNPDKKVIIKGLNLQLPCKKVTLLQGPSGLGKSTLFRAIAHIWPYLKPGAKVIFPGKSLEAHFIPQQSFIYHKGDSLLDTILYPTKKSCSKGEIADIKTMLKEVGIKPKVINKLEKNEDWEKLSGGEKQRVAIVSAIVNLQMAIRQNPKSTFMLFMDEGTSALDHNTKMKTEKLFKQKLPGVTIVYIDHNPSHHEAILPHNVTPLFKHKKSQFCDNEIQIRRPEGMRKRRKARRH